MDIRTLQSLQQAFPILLRHLGAYLELAEQDLAATRTNAVVRLRLLGVCIVSGVFALLTVCLFVVALTWDSDNRLLAVGLMASIFVLVAVISGIYLGVRRTAKPFATVRREWQRDRTLVYGLLSDREHRI